MNREQREMQALAALPSYRDGEYIIVLEESGVTMYPAKRPSWISVQIDRLRRILMP